MLNVAEKKDRGIDLSDLPDQGFPNDSSNFTVRGYYPEKVDFSVQGNMDKGINESVQIEVIQHDMSVQMFEDGLAVDCSIQKYGPAGEDISIQKSTLSRHDASIQPSNRNQDKSISMSKKERSFGIQ